MFRERIRKVLIINSWTSSCPGDIVSGTRRYAGHLMEFWETIPLCLPEYSVQATKVLLLIAWCVAVGALSSDFTFVLQEQ